MAFWYLCSMYEHSNKQERKVVHLQLGDVHEYFGSIQQLFTKYSKEDLGISIFQVRNNLKNKKYIVTDKCVLRFGILQTKSKNGH